MENKNIVMLKCHFVSYKDPKTTTYYLNQCRNLADYEVIDVTSKNRDPQFKSDISPMYIGPFVTPDGVTCNVFELLWQCSKVYPCHVNEDGEPAAEYFDWRNKHFAEPKPALNDKRAVKRIRHINDEICSKHKDTLYSLWYNPLTKKYEHLSYVEARKKIYLPVYAKLVAGTKTFKMLKDKVDAGEKLALLDFDAFNIYDDTVKERMYQKYLDSCKKNKITPARTLDDYLSLNTVKDVIDCPFLSVGHGFALKALLQGDIEVVNGEVIDHAGILQ